MDKASGTTKPSDVWQHLPEDDPDGLSYVDVAMMPEVYMCSICHTPLYTPVMLPCGHMFCAIHFRSGRIATCPMDRQPLDPSSLVPMRRGDNPAYLSILNILDAAKVRCTNKGCEWTGPRGNLNEHLHNNCGEHKCLNAKPAQNTDTKDGEHCSWTGTMASREAHLTECQFQRVACPYAEEGCDCNVVRLRLDAHVAEDCAVTKRLRLKEDEARAAEEAAARLQEQILATAREEMRLALDRINPQASNVITLNIGGTHHASTSLATFSCPLCPPESLLGTLFDPRCERSLNKDVNGAVFIDRPGDAFVLLLRVLVEGKLRTVTVDSAAEMEMLRIEAAFWGLSTAIAGLTPPPPVAPQRGLPTAYTQERLDWLLDRCLLSSPAMTFDSVSFRGLHFGGTRQMSNWKFINCDLRDVNMDGMVVAGNGIILQHSNLEGAQLPKNLARWALTGCNLSNCDLSHCSCEVAHTIHDKVTLAGSNLQGAKLPADINLWNLANCNLSDCDLSHCRGDKVTLSSAIRNACTKLPDDCYIKRWYL